MPRTRIASVFAVASVAGLLLAAPDGIGRAEPPAASPSATPGAEDGWAVVFLPGAGAPQATGGLVINPGGRSATLRVENPDAEGGEDYDIVGIADGRGETLAGVRLDAAGRGLVEFGLDRPFMEYRGFQVRVAPDDGDAGGGALVLAAEVVAAATPTP